MRVGYYACGYNACSSLCVLFINVSKIISRYQDEHAMRISQAHSLPYQSSQTIPNASSSQTPSDWRTLLS